VRIACLKSLRIGSVQFASNSTHIKIASIAAAGASQSEDRNDKQKTGFFDSIGGKQIFAMRFGWDRHEPSRDERCRGCN
jgi:hypothetical protein